MMKRMSERQLVVSKYREILDSIHQKVDVYEELMENGVQENISNLPAIKFTNSTRRANGRDEVILSSKEKITTLFFGTWHGLTNKPEFIDFLDYFGLMNFKRSSDTIKVTFA